MELINKDAIKSKIENLINENIADKKDIEDRFSPPLNEYYEGYEDALISIKNILNNIETKEVDLEKEIDNIWNPRFNLGWDEKSLLSINHEGFTIIAKHFFELGLAQKDLTLSNYDKAMITTITNALNYLEELNDSKGHDNVPSQYQSEKDWLESLKQMVKGD